MEEFYNRTFEEYAEHVFIHIVCEDEIYIHLLRSLWKNGKHGGIKEQSSYSLLPFFRFVFVFFYYSVDSVNRDYFSVTLKKTGYISQQGNAIIVVEFEETPRESVESKDFIVSGCLIVVTNAAKTYQLEVVMLSSQCSIVMERRAIFSTAYTPNEKSNVLTMYRTEGNDFESSMNCSRELSAFQHFFISCQLVFTSSVAYFRPNYVHLSSGEVKAYSTVFVSRSRSIIVIWIDLPSDPTDSISIQLLYGCATNDDGNHSMESSVYQIAVNASPFPVALSVETTHQKACSSGMIILLLNSTTYIPGISSDALSVQGAEISTIVRHSTSAFIDFSLVSCIGFVSR